MDYEIKQYGSYYVDSRTKDEKFPVLYASIPVDDVMPNVPFEKLEDLYLTDDQNDPKGILEASSLYLTDQQNEVTTDLKEPKTEALIVKDLKKELEKVQAFLGFGRKWHPDGFVRVQSSQGGAYEPLRNAEIEIYNWFFNAYCHTDNNGYFRSPERFSREMGVYSTWDGNCKISTHWNEILGIRRSDKLGNIGRPTKDFRIDYEGKHLWKKAITHNALQRFNEYATSQGIGTLPKIHIWTFEGIHRGAAPMMHYYPWGVAQNALLADWLKWVSPITLPVSSVLSLTASGSFPDVILNYDKNDTKERCERLAFHEFSHALHARQAGQEFWAIFVRRTVDNILAQNSNPYGDGTQPSAWSGQNIALCEGWSNFMEHKMMTHYYPNNFDWYSLERFRMHTVPTNIDNDNFPINGFYRGWFLHGLMWDLIDDAVDTNIELRNGMNHTVIGRGGVDNVQISINQLFNALQRGTDTPVDLKRRLKEVVPAQANQIEQLFNAYGI